MAALPVSLNDLCHGDVAHCVVLSPADCQPADAAVRLAHAVIGDDVFVNDSLEAFAELALQDRLNAFRKAWGLRPVGLTCLIVDRPDSAAYLDDIIEAAREYLGDVVVVQYDPESDQPWRDGDDRPIDAERNVSPIVRELLKRQGATRSVRTLDDAVVEQPNTRERSTPHPSGLRYVEAAIDDGEEGDEEENDASSPVVTREELAMLLGQDEPPQSPPPTRPPTRPPTDHVDE